MITFKVAQIRELQKMVNKGQITFTRFVEILDEYANSENSKALISKNQLKAAFLKRSLYLSNHPEDHHNFDYCNATLSELNKLAEQESEAIINIVKNLQK